MIFERSTESCAPFFSAPLVLQIRKSAQISTTLKVSVKPFQRLAGVKGRGTPAGKSFILLYGLSVCGSVPIIDWVRSGKSTGQRPLSLSADSEIFLSFRTEQGVRNATAFRGGATKNAPPSYGTD